MDSLLQSLAVDARIFGSLRTRQIDQVALRNSLHVLTQLLRLNLNHEDAVTTGGGIVFRGLGHDSVRISDEEQVQGILLRLSPVH